MNYTKYFLDSGEIYSTGSCLEEDLFLHQEPGSGILPGVEASNDVNYVFNNILLEYTPEQKLKKQQQPSGARLWSNVTFEWIDTRTQQEKISNAELEIKRIRNNLLQESDWTQLADIPPETKTRWEPYRQALRDVTLQPGYPNTVTWPTKPQ